MAMETPMAGYAFSRMRRIPLHSMTPEASEQGHLPLVGQVGALKWGDTGFPHHHSSDAHDHFKGSMAMAGTPNSWRLYVVGKIPTLMRTGGTPMETSKFSHMFSNCGNGICGSMVMVIPLASPL